MFNFLKIREYIDAKNDNEYYHFGFIELKPPTWEEILEEFDREYKIHLSTQNNDILKYQDRLGFVLHEAHQIKIVNDLLAEISRRDERNDQIYTALAYISLSSESATYGRHSDMMDVWCWQLTGYTLWNIEGKHRSFEKILEPGELIYVPRGMWHNTKPITPRASISFGSENIIK